MPKSRVNIRDIAHKTGVHPSTVSRVMNPRTRSMVSETVGKKILDTAEKMGYRPNVLASGLRTQRSYMIGVVTPDLSNPVFPPILRGIERTLDGAGYVTVMANSDGRQKSEKAIVEALINRRVDGLILATAHRTDPVVEHCVNQEIPLVLVNRTVRSKSVTSVVNDDEWGIRLAVSHLFDLGHKKLAFIGGPLDTSTGHARHKAFLKTVKSQGLRVDSDLVETADAYSIDAGQRSMEALIKSRKTFTAVVAANDLLAMGCVDALERAGLSCPQDISIIGFNDMPYVDRMVPPLTTLRISHDAMGVEAAKSLLNIISHSPKKPESVQLRPELIVRQSTAAAAKRLKRKASQP